MPTYVFKCIDTDEVFELSMRMSERDKFLKEHSNLEPIVTAPALVSGSVKAPSGFNEVLSKVAEAHPNSSVGERYGRKTISQARTSTILEKHRKSLNDKINSN